jgi:hypothetical protein
LYSGVVDFSSHILTFLFKRKLFTSVISRRGQPWLVIWASSRLVKSVSKAPCIFIVIIITLRPDVIAALTLYIKDVTRSIIDCFKRAPLYYRLRILLVSIV